MNTTIFLKKKMINKIKLIILLGLFLLIGCSDDEPQDTTNYTALYDVCSRDLKQKTIEKNTLTTSYKQLEQENIGLSDQANKEKKKCTINSTQINKKVNSTACLPYILTVKRLEKQINESYILRECDNNTLKINLSDCRAKLREYDNILDQTIEDLKDI